MSMAALVGGCTGSDDSEPATLPDTTPSVTESVTTSPTAEATTSPSPTPTADPTAVLEAELEAFFRTYDAALNESWTSMDALGQRREMFSDSCVVCLSGYEMTREAHDDRLEFRGDPSEIVEIDVTILAEDRASLLVLSNVPAGRLVDDEGEVVQSFQRNPEVQIVYEVHRVKGQWVIVRSEVL